MSDREFEILDELYLIKSYEELAGVIGAPDLQKDLLRLLEKGWITCYGPIDKEISYRTVQFEENFRKYYYIATKAGLLAHHGKE